MVRTEFQHNDLSDRGPDRVKTHIQAILDKFLDEKENLLAPVPANKPNTNIELIAAATAPF